MVGVYSHRAPKYPPSKLLKSPDGSECLFFNSSPSTLTVVKFNTCKCNRTIMSLVVLLSQNSSDRIITSVYEKLVWSMNINNAQQSVSCFT